MTAFIYIINRFFYRFFEFWRHWYVTSFKVGGHIFISLLERLDQTIALRITLKNLFQPLYQDKSFIGYFLGFIFRTFRLFLGGIFYLILTTIALAVYLAWLAVPLLIVFEIAKSAGLKF